MIRKAHTKKSTVVEVHTPADCHKPLSQEDWDSFLDDLKSRYDECVEASDVSIVIYHRGLNPILCGMKLTVTTEEHSLG